MPDARALAVYCATLVAVASAGVVHAQADEHARANAVGNDRRALVERLDAYVLGGMRAAGDPGAALVVVDDRGIVHCRGFGADTQGRAITCGTRFAVASLTKGFTAVAVMASAERGRVRLDAAVKAHLPWFRPRDDPPITVADLLLMRSGLSTEDGKRWLASREDDASAIERRVRALGGAALFAPPGTTFAYSNANYAALGAVLQAANGEPYEAVMRKLVMTPLGITGARFSRDPRFAGDAPMRGFSRVFGVPIPALPAPRDRGDDPAAGLVIDAQELGRYLSAHVDAGATWSARVLSRDGWRKLHHSPVDSPYAMGWYDSLIDNGAHHLYRHDGLAPDYHAFAVFVPHRNVGAALLVNASEEPDGGRREVFDRGILRILLGEAPVPPPAIPSDLPMRLALFAGLIAAIAGGLRSGRSASTRRGALVQAAILVVVGVALWLYVAPQMGGTLAAGFAYSPDLGAMLIALFAVIAATAAAAFVRALRSR